MLFRREQAIFDCSEDSREAAKARMTRRQNKDGHLVFSIDFRVFRAFAASRESSFHLE